MNITIDEVVQAYVSTRDRIKELEAELEATLKPLKEVQEKRAAYLLAQLNDSGAQSIKTPHGTVFTVTKESLTVADWDAALSYIKSNEAYDLLERRISKTAALALMGDDRENPPPPGVNYVAIRDVQIRRK